MVWKAWDWLRPPGVQAEVSRRFEGDGEESLQGRLRRSHREEGGKPGEPGVLDTSTLILRVLMNHRISNLFGVEMAGMSAYKFAPVNLTWVIFNFLNRIKDRRAHV